MDMQELVRAVAQEILKQLRSGTAAFHAPETTCVMVLATRDEALVARVQACLDGAADVLFFGEDVGNRSPARFILPVLSCGAMAELAGGKASGPFLCEALRLLLAGVEVAVLEFEYRAYRETAPDPLFSLYQGYEQTLATYGLKEFRRQQPGTRRHLENLVTEQTVIQAQQQGASVLLVPATAKVTPLAADTARELNINILKRS